MHNSCSTWALSGGRTEIRLGGAGVRGYEAADYLHEAFACKSQELGPLAPPPPPPGSAALVGTKMVVFQLAPVSLVRVVNILRK